MLSKQLLKFKNSTETIYIGKQNLKNLPQLFKDVKQIGIIGWGSQAFAQSQNLRDSINKQNLDINVKVGLRNNSKSITQVNDCGFTKDSNTQGEMYSVMKESDLNLVLISDMAQIEIIKN